MALARWVMTTQGGRASLTVTAGKFDATLVEGENFEIQGTKTTIRQWYVKDKGPVKLVYVISGTESVLELEKFEEGK